MNAQINLDIQTKSKKWTALKDIEKLVGEISVQLILKTELKKFLAKKTNLLEVSISLVCDAQIKKINYKFRGKNKATDVLSFPFIDKKALKSAAGPVFLGDIVLAFETIKREADAAKKNFNDHLTHLLLHSILHLLGYDHENAADAKKMEALEILILNEFGIRNPYA